MLCCLLVAILSDFCLLSLVNVSWRPLHSHARTFQCVAASITTSSGTNTFLHTKIRMRCVTHPNGSQIRRKMERVERNLFRPAEPKWEIMMPCLSFPFPHIFIIFKTLQQRHSIRFPSTSKAKSENSSNAKRETTNKVDSITDDRSITPYHLMANKKYAKRDNKKMNTFNIEKEKLRARSQRVQAVCLA